MGNKLKQLNSKTQIITYQESKSQCIFNNDGKINQHKKQILYIIIAKVKHAHNLLCPYIAIINCILYRLTSLYQEYPDSDDALALM